MAEIDLDRDTIASLQDRMRAGTLSARALTRHCLDRIAAFDDRLNAVIELNPEALDIAAALDRERAGGTERGPLHGMPILIKDNLDTADRMMTTAGSLALVGTPAPKDAFVVQRLRAAGAVILGKTNLSEWANFRSTRSSSGWSSRGGQTRNPYDPLRSPGGSSSGSAVAVAAGFCVAAIGTETDGSIVSPAAMNSVVGVKPTVGLVGRSGIIPISQTQDTAGPMARTVLDAALVLAAICGPDPDDPATQGGQAAAMRADAGILTPDPGALAGARIGVARTYAGFHDRIDALLDRAVDDLHAGGAEVLDDLTLTPAEDMRPAEAIVFATEFKAGLNAYLAGRGDSVRVGTLAELIDFNRDHADEVMPWFAQELAERAQATQGLASASYLNALATCRDLSRARGIDHLVEKHRLDAIIAPSTCTPWLIDWVNGDNRSGGSAAPAAIAGYPNVTVPMGYVHGLPVGLSFFSTAWQEPKLLSLACGFETATRHRVAPVLHSGH